MNVRKTIQPGASDTPTALPSSPKATIDSSNPSTLAPTAPKDIVLAFISQFWNKGDLSGVSELLADDYRDHAYEPGNKEGLLLMAQTLRSAFPDQQSAVESVTVAGDRVVVRLRLTGTHGGSFRGKEATGLPIDVKVYREYRVESGRIAEHWALLDTAALLRQIGAELHDQTACRVNPAAGN